MDTQLEHIMCRRAAPAALKNAQVAPLYRVKPGRLGDSENTLPARRRSGYLNLPIREIRSTVRQL